LSAAAASPAPGTRLADTARRLVPLAWPVFVGQVAVLAFATIDTIFMGRTSAADLAALAIGGTAYITVFIGFMGAVMALGPIVGRLYGAGDPAAAGRAVHQAVWVALALSCVGSLLLLFPQPFLSLSQASPEVAGKVRGYLQALAFSLPASLLFTVFRGFNTAVSRPKPAMTLQLSGLALKVPLSAAFVFGVPMLGVPALGVVGCGIATAVAMWAQLAGGVWHLRRDPAYAPFALFGRGLDRPDRAALVAQLKLGIPMGSQILIDVTGFAFMAIFIARIGTTAVAGHQLAANLVSLMFMVPLALGSACGALVAQRLGAGDADDADRLAWHGLKLALLVAAALGLVVLAARAPILGLYTGDAAVIAAAMPLLAWVAVFHIADAAMAIASAVLRAHQVALLPVVIYAVALWGVGMGGGWLLAFDTTGHVPPALRGAPGYWLASTAALMVGAVGLTALMRYVLRRHRAAPAT
jgi:MATE family multidrug resistance protein